MLLPLFCSLYYYDNFKDQRVQPSQERWVWKLGEENPTKLSLCGSKEIGKEMVFFKSTAGDSSSTFSSTFSLMNWYCGII